MNLGTSTAIAISIIVSVLASISALPGVFIAQEMNPIVRRDMERRRSPTPDKSGLNYLGMSSPSSGDSADDCMSTLPLTAFDGTHTFSRVFQVNGANTWADAILPAADGSLVVSDYAIGKNFALNLTEFDDGGRPLRSRNLSIVPSLANTARVTSDGGVLIGAYTDSTQEREGLLVKLNRKLDVQWAKTFQSDGPSSVEGVAETADGGVIALVGDSWRIGIVKLDTAGKVAWKTAIVPQTGTNSHIGSAYDIHENTYVDAAGNRQCGGYVVYGVVNRPATNWDLYLAALSCDGNTLLWQRIVSGPSWEASQPMSPGEWFPRSTNLAVIEDRNSTNVQDVDLLLAATTGSYGTDEAIMLVPFTVSGGTTLSSVPAFGTIKILDGPDAERLVGTFGGPNLIRLSDGSPLLAGSVRSPGSGNTRALLVKMDPSLNVLWQFTYSMEEMLSLYEGASTIRVAGGGLAGMILNLAPDGSGESPCVTRTSANLMVSDVSPGLITPAYALADGALQITDIAITMTETSAILNCPNFLYVPSVRRN